MKRHFEKDFRTTNQAPFFTAYVDGSSFYSDSVHGTHTLKDGRVAETKANDWTPEGRWFTIVT